MSVCRSGIDARAAVIRFTYTIAREVYVNGFGSAALAHPVVCGKDGGDGMDSSTPTPTLPRCGRWRVLQGREHIGGRPQDEACNTGRVELQTV